MTPLANMGQLLFLWVIKTTWVFANSFVLFRILLGKNLWSINTCDTTRKYGTIVVPMSNQDRLSICYCFVLFRILLLTPFGACIYTRKYALVPEFPLPVQITICWPLHSSSVNVLFSCKELTIMENVKTLPKFHPDDSKREKGLMYCESVALELVASESLNWAVSHDIMCSGLSCIQLGILISQVKEKEVK